jgi:hypothetical protein
MRQLSTYSCPLSLLALATVPSGIVPPDVIQLPNMVFTFLPDLHLLVSYQLKTTATDAEWDGYLATMARALRSARFRSLVVTEGAHPTRAQQALMTALVKGKPSRVAVLSSASGVRFVVSVFALLNRNVKAYSPKDYESAFSHLDLAPVERKGVVVVIDRLREKLEPPPGMSPRRPLLP